MRLLLLAVLSSLFVGCTFGVKTCSPSDPCQGEGVCTQGVCTIPVGGGDGGNVAQDAGADAGRDAGSTGGGGGRDAGPYDAGPLEGLVFLTAPASVLAGNCSPEVRVGVYQDAGPSEDGGVFPVEIGPLEDGHFFADPTCSQEIWSLDIPSSGIISFYFSSTTLGSLLVGVSQNQAGPSSQVEHVVAAGPARLAFGPPATVLAGDCSEPVSIQMRDRFGNRTVVSYAVPVQLFSTSATRFYDGADVACINELPGSALEIAPGNHSGSFRFIQPTPGQVIFSAESRDAGLEVVPATSDEQTVL